MKKIKCPKCSCTSGDDWSQCAGSCPMPISPHYSGTINVGTAPSKNYRRKKIKRTTDGEIYKSLEVETLNKKLVDD